MVILQCHAYSMMTNTHDDVNKWKHFLRCWPFVRGFHWSPVNSPHRDHWCRALLFSLICAWLHGWVNNREAGDLRRHNAHYDVIVISMVDQCVLWFYLYYYVVQDFVWGCLVAHSSMTSADTVLNVYIYLCIYVYMYMCLQSGTTRLWLMVITCNTVPVCLFPALVSYSKVPVSKRVSVLSSAPARP